MSNNVRMKRHLPRRLQLSLHVPTHYCIVSWKSKKQCANHLPPALVRVISSRGGCGNHVHVHVYIQSSENSCSHEHYTIIRSTDIADPKRTSVAFRLPSSKAAARSRRASSLSR